MLADANDLADFRRLHDPFGHPTNRFTYETVNRRVEHDLYWSIRRPLETQLLAMLRSGEFKAERIDPDRGAVEIPTAVWELAEPYFVESTALVGDRKFEGIRVWPVGNRPRTTIKQEHACKDWIRELKAQGYIPETRPKLREEAQHRFPGLSGRAFDRCWEAERDDDWTEPGVRPSKRLAPRAVKNSKRSKRRRPK